MKLTGPGKDRRRLFGARREGARGGGEGREVRLAHVKASIGVVNGIPGTVRADFHLRLKPGVKRRRIDEGRERGGKGVGESPKGRGIPCEVDLARGPAVRAAGTRGGKGGRGRRGPHRTTGTGRRALRGGKGRGRAFGRRPRDKGARWRGGKAETGQGGFNIHTTRRERSRGGCRTLGTR